MIFRAYHSDTMLALLHVLLGRFRIYRPTRRCFGRYDHGSQTRPVTHVAVRSAHQDDRDDRDDQHNASAVKSELWASLAPCATNFHPFFSSSPRTFFQECRYFLPTSASPPYYPTSFYKRLILQVFTVITCQHPMRHPYCVSRYYVYAQVDIPTGLDFGYCQADDVSERVIYVRNTGEVRKHPSFAAAVWANNLNTHESEGRYPAPKGTHSRRAQLFWATVSSACKIRGEREEK